MVRNTYCDDMYPSIRYSNDSNGYLQQLAVLQSTYFILDVEYTDSNKEPSDYILNIQQYQLADLTLKGKLYTRAGTIAGDDLLEDKQVAYYEYVYPTRVFNRIVSLRTVTEDDNGNLIPITVYKIKVEFQPKVDPYYYPLLDYLRMKYNYDIALKNNGIADPLLTELILCSEDANNTYKPITIESYNTNFVSFLDRFYMLYLPDTAKQAFNVNNLLDIPVWYSLQALTPMDVKITVQPYANSIEYTNVYQLPAYQQYSSYQKDIFLGASIWTDKYVKRYGTQVAIEPPAWFRVDRVEVNSQEYGIFVTTCNVGCTISIGKGEVSLWVRNEWDAVGYAHYQALEVAVEPVYDAYSIFFLFIAWSITALVVLYFLRRKFREAF
jgi:hypothetical protein